MAYYGEYYMPFGVDGIGQDIRWCGRWTTGKHCQLCMHHATFAEWSKEWKWYYLLYWYDTNWKYSGYMEFASYKHHWSWRYGSPPSAYSVKPKKYRSTGLSEMEFKSLMKKGCNPRKKCKCVSVAQRGQWYCPECFEWVKLLAKHNKCHIHDIMITERNDLKEDLLIMKLSGAFHI
jgi:hypothetical protein